MSINVKKYTKDQMAKMVEDAQEKTAALEAEIAEMKNCIDEKNDLIAEYANLKAEMQRKNAALTEQIDQMNGEAINKANEIANLKADADALRNKLGDTEAALGRANAELGRANAELGRANAELGAAEGALGEMIELRAKLSDAEEKKEKMNATLADCRVTLAQEVEKRKDWEQRSVWQFNHPWRNLWAWVKRKLGGKGNEHVS
nr:MAG TPA: chromosome segregation ATPase [Caudoviricetes sp.]